MKVRTRNMVIAAVILLAVGAVGFAQSADSPWGKTVTVDGTLQLQNGRVVLVSGDTSYFVPEVLRYVGFVDGLKEGAKVSVEGYTDGYRLMPTAFTVNGKSYDLSGRFDNPGYGGPRGDNWGGYGGHRGGWGGCGGGYGRGRGGCW